MRKFLPLLLAPFVLGQLLIAAPSYAKDKVPAKPAPVARVTKPAKAPKADAVPWLYKGSDIPPDPAWSFGTLPNGLRYAVRKNDVPTGQVSIRVLIDAGSLHEKDNELGYAHLIEHLSFRGSTYVPDGESKRIWQRLGVSFGNDSNAQTTPTQTVYKLDLPNANPASLDESVKILSGMMRAPNISESALKAERAIVQAELRESSGPAMDYQDASRETVFKGQLMASRPTIGTIATLDAATVKGLTEFHDRWYRPENAVVVVSGDADPIELTRLIAQHFSGWKGTGRAGIAPDFGKPASGEAVRLVQQPTLPANISLVYVRPWEQVQDTVVYNEQLMIDALAVQIINRRLEQQARAGGNYLLAEAEQQDIARSVDQTSIYITPVEDRWEDATRDVRAVIADATATPPSQADINREYALMLDVMRTRAENASFEASSIQADNIVNAVDIRETVAAQSFALQVTEGLKSKITPERVFEATKRQFSGVGSRLILSSPKPVDNGEARMVAVLNEAVTANAGARLADNNVGFDALPALGVPASIKTSETNADLGMTRVELSNGVRALLYPNKREPDQIRMVVRFGNGVRGVVPRPGDLLWAGPLIFGENGVGDLKQLDIDKMAVGRRIGLSFGIDNDAFEYSSTTRPTDLADQLKLIAAKLEHPGWDAAPVARARELARSGNDSYEMSAMSILERDLSWLVANKDSRFKSPDPDEIRALTPEAFRRFWEPLLAQGPVEVLIFGDFDVEAAKTALQSTLGAMKPRNAVPPSAAALVRQFPAPNVQPVRLSHKGPKDQAAAVLAWPTGGGLDDVGEGRALEILAAVFSDRLFEKFRSEMAASYSPDTSSSWPTEFPSGGYIFAYSQVKPDEVSRFFEFAEEVAKDLVANPVTPDELKRAVEPKTQQLDRMMSGNTYWLMQLKGVSWEPGKFKAFSRSFADYEEITPASLQALAKRYLVPGKAWKLEVDPTGSVPASGDKEVSR